MAPVPVVQQPEHGKARRTAESIGADRVLPVAAAPSTIQGEVRANNFMEPTQLNFRMGNRELKAEAELLIHECHLPELLAAYPSWFIGGSYSYDLMCWRDLDVYVLDPQHDLKHCFEVAYELTCLLAARKSRFTNNIGGEPNGLYWGIKLGDERQGAWKLDVWFLDSHSYEEHANYSAKMVRGLTTERRSAIIEIKEAYWRRPEYRDTITSDLIYRAVLNSGVKSVAEFEGFLVRAPPDTGVLPT